ncbi:MAG: beta-1,6-N-acetylglucosaminyltransferase [Pseudomonadota bacterium]
MSSLGFVMLCHTALDRAADVARYWAERDCPVVVHVDRRTPDAEFDVLQAALSDLWNVRFSGRFACEWGRWSLVAASQEAAQMLLREFIDVRHVYLASGACLPVRPLDDLRDFLARHPRTDFIESVTTEDVDWTQGGLAEERFRMRFPFSWKRQRWLFDRSVEFQRRLGLARSLPDGVDPHLGSQWWCLTRQTLSAILQDPRRRVFDRYFRTVWIPDESYFQTLARRYSIDLQSRSLTLSKFDFQGKPHVFYDDHLDLLTRSDCFVARKVWPRAGQLYDRFLASGPVQDRDVDPAPARIERVFHAARTRRSRGRRGLFMAGRFPRNDWESGRSAAPYTICHGFNAIFSDFDGWLARRSGLRVHGHLFAPEKVEFAEGRSDFVGGLTSSAALRDYNPGQFLTNLIWNSRGERQVFQFGPNDRQEVGSFLAGDDNASLWIVTGAWALPLFLGNADFGDIRKQAARLQRVEAAFLNALQGRGARADLHIWTLADFLTQPMEHLQELLDHVAGPAAPRLSEAPRMADLAGFPRFVESLKNQGMNPHLVGDFGPEEGPDRPKNPAKPYLVR